MLAFFTDEGGIAERKHTSAIDVVAGGYRIRIRLSGVSIMEYNASGEEKVIFDQHLDLCEGGNKGNG